MYSHTLAPYNTERFRHSSGLARRLDCAQTPFKINEDDFFFFLLIRRIHRTDDVMIIIITSFSSFYFHGRDKRTYTSDPQLPTPLSEPIASICLQTC